MSLDSSSFWNSGSLSKTRDVVKGSSTSEALVKVVDGKKEHRLHPVVILLQSNLSGWELELIHHLLK